MKHILVLLFTVCSLSSATAQSLGEQLQHLLGGESNAPKQEKTEPIAHPSVEALLGVWTYQEPSIEYKGEDLLASLAISALKDQLATSYIKGGITPGEGTISFRPKGKLHASIAKQEIDGFYTYDPAKGIAAITLTKDGVQGTFRAYLFTSGGLLTLQFDANDAIQAVRHASPQYANNEKLQKVSTVLQGYPGVMLGGRLKK